MKCPCSRDANDREKFYVSDPPPRALSMMTREMMTRDMMEMSRQSWRQGKFSFFVKKLKLDVCNITLYFFGFAAPSRIKCYHQRSYDIRKILEQPFILNLRPHRSLLLSIDYF